MDKESERHFQLQAEIDYLFWQLEQMLEVEKRRSIIERMIDESTGFDKVKLKKARRIIGMIRRRRKEFESLNG